MTGLSTDEQRYLLDAFASSPRDWFRPREVDRDQFSNRTIDQIVESLSRRGLMQGEPDCHTRLTDRGRKTAARLGLPVRSEWRTLYARRRVRIAVASATVVLCLLVIALRWTSLL